MAEILEEFDFGRLKHGGKGRYDKYLDGQIWKLTLDDAPATNSIRVMQTAIAGAARRKGLSMRTNVIQQFDEDGEPIEDEAVIVVQAYKLDPDDPNGETELDPEDWDD